ncbi:MAG TPA: transcriptional regulator [Acidimicrobiales bacterium]|nr:transcriptional regulator [Acidimicrobiales bacterium]
MSEECRVPDCPRNVDEHPLLIALEPVADALGATLVAPEDMCMGDIALEWDGEIVGGFRQAGLQYALDRLLAMAESDLGVPLDQLPRELKQSVVARLDDQGAFVVRRAVEEVADRMGVSRFTIYNYLNARDSDGGNTS